MEQSQAQPGHSWPSGRSSPSNVKVEFQTLPSPPQEAFGPPGQSRGTTANLAAAVAPPSHMHAGQDPLGAPPSFTARRPHASHLPSFELPPPHMHHQKYQPYPAANVTQSSQTPGSLTSVGNLLTPPTNVPGDGLSPVSTGVNNASLNSTQGVQPQGVQQYNPNGYAWHQSSQHGSAQYGYQPGSNSQPFNPPRGLFSPSVNSLNRNGNSSSVSDGLPPPPYDINLPPYPTSGPMSAPSNLPTMSAQQQQHAMTMMSNQPPVSAATTQPSPVQAQEAFHAQRPPPTPTYYNTQPSTTPQPQNFPYSSGPSPTQQSPMSAGGPMSRLSPPNSGGSVSSMQSAQAQSPHPYGQRHSFGGYPLPGPVMSNLNHANGHIALVAGMPHGMMQPYNSGHAAMQHHLYQGHPPPQQQPPNDRPFKCDQCPQSFNRNHDLKRHKRIHLAVKPFPCGHCEKSFSRKDALKVSEPRVRFLGQSILTSSQRHILVKGCGKAQAATDGDKNDNSLSPGDKTSVMSQTTESSGMAPAP